MRKRMSRMKKEMAVAVAAAMCISLVGCGGGSSKKVVADKKEAVETTVAETTETETTAEKLTGVNDSEMADILAGTTWAGISSTQEIMVAAFDEKDAYLVNFRYRWRGDRSGWLLESRYRYLLSVSQ